MPKPLHEKLREKGWSEEEIKKTMTMLRSPEKSEKHQEMQTQMSFSLYWMLLIVLTIVNFFVSIALIPLMLVLQVKQLTVIVGVVGLGLGLLFNVLIWDIEHLEKRHHIGAVLFLPILAIVTISLIVIASNRLAEHIVGGVHQRVPLIAGTYVIGFLAPYAVSLLRKK